LTTSKEWFGLVEPQVRFGLVWTMAGDAMFDQDRADGLLEKFIRFGSPGFLGVGALVNGKDRRYQKSK
jgi:hypothetical protein